MDNNAVKERGMIFNAEMVRAILDGRKTQTRRIISDRHIHLIDAASQVGECYPLESGVDHGNSQSYYREHCPFGKPGDRIWVRETWSQLGNEDGCAINWNDELVKGGGPEAARIYRASCEQKPGNYGLWSIPDDAFWKPHTDSMEFEGAWRPSIHMPRWASRITLEITDVRVERLNDISQSDALSEGMPVSHPSIDSVSRSLGYPDFSRSAFAQLWQSIYGEESWQANPWVWVIEFKRVEGE
ncbi:hypothetical protein TUM12370_24700 [Salmonella enterica subsp. enterica serovar Choleraesuis]|nr:hypothetical protein TUM12370_24700 [Salmonella enterica subsp. enterica serovar Choleraesuis]